jgi:hypothetical protein
MNAVDQLENSDLTMLTDYVMEKINDIEIKNVMFDVITLLLP